MEFYFKIEKNNNGVKGILPNTNSKKTDKFNPLTAIGDLIHFTRNPQLFDDKAITTFKEIFKFEQDVDEQELFDYYEKMCDLRTYIQGNTLFTYSELEQLKSFYDLTFRSDIYTNVPLKFGYCSTEKALEVSNKEQYFYICYSMIDVPFAILHFLLRNDYKFKRCEHCEKFFATHSYKQKYCTRKSPLLKYSNLECGEAVNKAMVDLRKRKSTIYTNINRHHPENLNDFLDEFDMFGAVKSEKRAEDLDVLETLTDKKHRKRWY
ncbi:MAG: hypothetical protein ACLR19_05195 [Clostridia bacterium]